MAQQQPVIKEEMFKKRQMMTRLKKSQSDRKNAGRETIQTLTAIFISIGMGLILYSRSPVNVSSTNITPEKRTPVKAVCHGIPIVSTTVKAKNAFSPMPGAKAMGYFAITPIKRQPTKAARHVAT